MRGWKVQPCVKTSAPRPPPAETKTRSLHHPQLPLLNSTPHHVESARSTPKAGRYDCHSRHPASLQRGNFPTSKAYQLSFSLPMIVIMLTHRRLTDPVHVLSNSKLLRHVDARTYRRQAARTGNAVCTGHPMAESSVSADDNGLVDSTGAPHFLLCIAPEDIFGNNAMLAFARFPTAQVPNGLAWNQIYFTPAHAAIIAPITHGQPSSRLHRATFRSLHTHNEVLSASKLKVRKWQH